MVFESFQTAAPMPPATLDRYAGIVPDGLLQAWRDHGMGFIGDGYFRMVDPVRAAALLGGTWLYPGAVIVFTTALADVIAYAPGMFIVVKYRLGEVQPASIPFERLVALMGEDPSDRDVIWDWQPYPAARARLGVPGFEDCLMHVPLLGMGGRGDAAQMQTGSLWMHIGLMVQLTGQLKLTHQLPLPTDGHDVPI